MSNSIVVTAKVPAKDGKPELGPVSITVNSGSTAKEMIEMFGDEAVRSQAQGAWNVTLQSNMRSGLRKGETQEQMQTRLANAKMGISAKGATVDPQAAFQAQFLSATPEEQSKMIKDLQKRAAELRAN